MQLTDADRIRGLLGTYCRLVDVGDFVGVGALMADATLRQLDGSLIATGADEVAAVYAGLVILHEDGTPGTQHLVANTVFEEPAADGSVRATSSYLVVQAVSGLPLQPVVTGSYVDHFGQDDDGRWRFLERRLDIGRSGDLSHHLTLDIGDPS